jgi:hypothetical protein
MKRARGNRPLSQPMLDAVLSIHTRQAGDVITTAQQMIATPLTHEPD